MGQTHTPIHPYHANRVCILVKVEDPFLSLSLSFRCPILFLGLYFRIDFYTNFQGWLEIPLKRRGSVGGRIRLSILRSWNELREAKRNWTLGGWSRRVASREKKTKKKKKKKEEEVEAEGDGRSELPARKRVSLRKVWLQLPSVEARCTVPPHPVPTPPPVAVSTPRVPSGCVRVTSVGVQEPSCRRKTEGETQGDRRLGRKRKEEGGRRRRGREGEGGRGREREGKRERARAKLFLSSRVGAAIFPSS